jgi:plasmid maintenance system antidote protein VapI
MAKNGMRPVHPGEILREDSDTALGLARYFDSTPQFWLNLQSAYELRQAEIAAGSKVKREVTPAKGAA